MKDVTALVRAALSYLVKRENAYNRGESTIDRWNSPLPPTDDLYRATGWTIVHNSSDWIIKNRATDEIIATIPREYAAKKSRYLCYMDKMPKVPRMTI